MKTLIKILGILVLVYNVNYVKGQVYANSQTSGVYGTCSTCEVKTPNFAVDANYLNRTEMVVTSAVSGDGVYLNLHFPSVGAPGDYVAVAAEDYDNDYLTVSYLANTTLTTYRNGVSNNDTHNSSQYSITPLAGGGVKYTLEFPVSNSFDQVRIDMVGGVFGALTKLNVYYAYYYSTPLPVELVDFTVKQYYAAAKVHWTTASETNNDYFTVERTIDGINFMEVARVDGAGNSSVTQEYEIMDEEPATGLSYYRLGQTDYDGKVSYSHLAPFNFDYQSRKLKVFPNPVTNGNICFRFPDEGKHRIDVRDLQGRLVYSTYMEKPKDEMVCLPLSLTRSGLYMISLTSETHRYTAKLVVH